jgi:hypothetical protein
MPGRLRRWLHFIPGVGILAGIGGGRRRRRRFFGSPGAAAAAWRRAPRRWHRRKAVHQSPTRWIDFARLDAQQQEVVAGLEARLLQDAVGAFAGTLLEARLQGPDVLDVAGNPAGDRELFGLHVEDFVHRQEERRDRRFAARLERFPLGQHLMPEQGGEKEAGRDRFAFADAAIGASRASMTKRSPSAWSRITSSSGSSRGAVPPRAVV